MTTFEKERLERPGEQRQLPEEVERIQEPDLLVTKVSPPAIRKEEHEIVFPENAVRQKDEEIQRLRTIVKGKTTLVRQLRAEVGEFEHQRCSLTASVMESTVDSTAQAFSTFCSDLEKYRNRSEHADVDLHNNLNQFVEEECLRSDARPAHAIKAFVSSVIFEGFEVESFSLNCGYSVWLDPHQLKRQSLRCFQRTQNTDSVSLFQRDAPFREFCEDRSSCIFPTCTLAELQHGVRTEAPVKCRRLHKLARANSERRELEVDHHNLFKSFVTAAQRAWALQKLCMAFNTPATIFRVPPGARVQQILSYMDSVEELEVDRKLASEVRFMTFPGFRLGQYLVLKCQVYLAPAA